MTYKSLLGYFSSESTMFTSLPPRRLRWSAVAAGRSSPNCVPAPYSGNVTSRTRQNRSQSDAPGPKTDLRIISLPPERPQEISLLTLPVSQGAAVSSKRFSQSLPPRNVAELGGSPPLRGSLEQLGRPSPASPPLQGTELAALNTPEGQSRETGSLSRPPGGLGAPAKRVSLGSA